MQFPYTCTGSLSPSFLPARDVSLPVKRPYAFTLYMGRLPIGLRAPLEASVTLLEATTPVKLPTKQCPPIRVLGLRQQKGRISRTAPRILAYPIQSLRPILHIRCPSPVLSCSKGSRDATNRGRLSNCIPSRLTERRTEARRPGASRRAYLSSIFS